MAVAGFQCFRLVLCAKHAGSTVTHCSAQGRATCRKIRARLSSEFAPRTFRQKISCQASAAESARPGVRSSHFQSPNKSEAGLRRPLRSDRRNLLPTCWGLGEAQGTIDLEHTTWPMQSFTGGWAPPPTESSRHCHRTHLTQRAFICFVGLVKEQ